MTFYAREFRVLPARVNLEIQNSAVVGRGGDMTHIARRDRNFFRRRVERVHCRRVVTGRAIQIRVTRKLVAKRGGRIAPPPREHHNLVFYLHRRCRFRVEIRFPQRRGELVTGRAAGRCRQDSGVGRMTRKTGRVTGWRGFESSLLEPERVA